MKTLLVAAIFGIFGAVAVSISFAAHWPTWVMFIAWVSYYIFGKTWRSSAISFIQILLGIIMGLLIQLIAAFLRNPIGSWSLPLSVFFFIGSMPYIMKLKTFNNIPAWFLGLIVFFGIHPPIEPAALMQLLAPIAGGFILAGLNDATVEKVMEHKNSYRP